MIIKENLKAELLQYLGQLKLEVSHGIFRDEEGEIIKK